jgi:signal transduction histidine kinase
MAGALECSGDVMAGPADKDRDCVAGLADEQAALRRVATLVALGASAGEVFAAVTEEAGQLLAADFARLCRFESDDTITVIVGWGRGRESSGPRAEVGVGARLALGGDNVTTRVSQTGRPARIESFVDASGPAGAFARELDVRSAVGTPIVVEGRLWGVLIAASTHQQPLPADTEARLESFTELVATAIANAESHDRLGKLVEEQAALRRVATLVARGVPPREVVAAVAEEVGGLLHVDFAAMGRYGSDGTVSFAAGWDRGGTLPPVGRSWPLGGNNLPTLVWETGRPARIDSHRDLSGAMGASARERGVKSAVATPIMVGGRLWGVMNAGSTVATPLPPDAEARLASFTELVATAIANAESHGRLARLASEQAALGRVATLVARGVPPRELFAAVAEEVGRLLPVDIAGMGRYEADGTVTELSAWSAAGMTLPAVGSRWSLEGENVPAAVARTGRSARSDSDGDVPGPLGLTLRDLGSRSNVAAPIVVEGHLWGVMAAVSTGEQPLPPDTEARLASFTELVATAIANADSRAKLAASRARIVAAADQTRRRIERDLHDGAQQRLVSLGLELRAAQATVPPELGELDGELSSVAAGLTSVQNELREIARGIHPAILAEGGLTPALKTLARRSPLPVELDLRAQARLPEPVEVAAYYIVSETLTNAAKHAHASVMHVMVEAIDHTLRLRVCDDGDGGADPRRGSGLVGLKDRVETLGGTMTIESPPRVGTTVSVALPLED